ncbi:MAG: hypothetical protein QNK35_01705 [Bacteroides sp.]|nr:hypothetical protein [Bacteroides sp.]
MYQKDYILRMVEQMAELVAGILGLIKEGDFPKATQSIENAYQDLLKEDAAFFSTIPLADLTQNLIQEHNYTNGHLEILSQLFYAQAELDYAQGNRDSGLQYYQKSLLLLEFVLEDSNSFSIDKKSRLSSMQKRIAELSFK